MSELFSLEQQKHLLRRLAKMVERRRASATTISQGYRERIQSLEQQTKTRRTELQETYRREKRETAQEYEAIQRATASRYDADHTAAQREYDAILEVIDEHFTRDMLAAQRRRDESSWEAKTIYDVTKDRPKQEFEEVVTRLGKLRSVLGGKWNEVQQTHENAADLLRDRGQYRVIERPDAREPQAGEDEPLGRLTEAAALAGRQYEQLRDQTIVHLFTGARPLGVLAVIWLVMILPALAVTEMQWSSWQWIALSAGSAVAILGGLYAWLFPMARRRSMQGYLDLLQILVDAEAAHEAGLQWVAAEHQRRQEIMRQQEAAAIVRRDEEIATAEQSCRERVDEITAQRDSDLRLAGEKYDPLLAEITEIRDHALRDAQQTYPARLARLDEANTRDLDMLAAGDAREHEDCEAFQRDGRAETADTWHRNWNEVLEAADELCRASDALFPNWSELAGQGWTSPEDVPPAIRFGQYRMHLAHLPQGLPEEEHLQPERTSFSVPALLPFPDSPSLLLRTDGEGRDKALELLQAVSLRLLTSLPAGKVRFTIFDPVGLGDNFSAFMHLADYDELLVTGRIWTEKSHIEKRLADLTEHMENVFQKYLRNEFESIQQYNAQAGEVAEPFRILVVPDFPAGFSDTAARRLVSIATSGARCGVYTLVGVDTRQKLPYNFDLADLRRHATCLEWQNGRFLWKDPDLARLPLTLDTPPEGELFSQIVRDVGLQSKDARRVEVAFERIAPPGESLWQGDAKSEVDVPLGRAGATKLQHMRLGRGTSQHVLVAGKTGSGKSSFLHALVTNAALHYSPHEIEFYLIDFKKGVEFKTYATHKLPHARVIAIESEREFGLSVLQRLDAELKERGDLMRRCGVQDLASYRAAKPDAVMPRVLLIIDEFQEFFTEDDPLSSQASLLLDRLVRQGRAFGIHVLLGSQSLGGAYSLARSTMGQVAVRIALQCSESDAHLILSEENTAARLLTRPGEAIYNDANGLLEGNNPFQVAWLPDAERETYLKQLQTMAAEQEIKMPPPIVFEGNVPAEASENATLVDLLASPTWQQLPLAPKAWLGAAVAIKEPTAAEFRRQSGSNLLICGQSTDSALGIMTASVLSLAVQYAPSAAEFYLLDGTRPDDVEADQWQRIAGALPHTSQVVRPRKAAGAINEIAAEVARRDAEDDENAPPIYLFIYHLGRFRDLRRDDDAFSFGSASDDNPPSASKQLAAILRDGPALGVHTTIWCDTFANTERWLDRPAMRELEMRIAFQMSAADSSSLIDSPIAAKLGVHRALLYLEEYGALEKFRPYGPPSDEWLDEATRRLQQAAASVSG